MPEGGAGLGVICQTSFLRMSLKPFAITLGISLFAIVIYKKFLGGRFGLPV